MSVPSVRAARVYDRTVHWRETTYQGYALHQTSLSQMEMASHTLCDNCHEKRERRGIRLESCQSCAFLFWICVSTLQQMAMISRLFNCGVRMEMIDYDCSTLQSKQSITRKPLSDITRQEGQIHKIGFSLAWFSHCHPFLWDIRMKMLHYLSGVVTRTVWTWSDLF